MMYDHKDTTRDIDTLFSLISHNSEQLAIDFIKEKGGEAWLLAALNSDRNNGISSGSLERRKSTFGSNMQGGHYGSHYNKSILHTLTESKYFLSILFLAGLQTAFRHDHLDATKEGLYTILLVVAYLCVCHMTNFTRARQKEKVSKSIDGMIQYNVMRDGRLTELAQREILIGDILHLEANRPTPVDGLVLPDPSPNPPNPQLLRASCSLSTPCTILSCRIPTQPSSNAEILSAFSQRNTYIYSIPIFISYTIYTMFDIYTNHTYINILSYTLSCASFLFILSFNPHSLLESVLSHSSYSMMRYNVVPRSESRLLVSSHTDTVLLSLRDTGRIGMRIHHIHTHGSNRDEEYTVPSPCNDGGVSEVASIVMSYTIDPNYEPATLGFAPSSPADHTLIHDQVDEEGMDRCLLIQHRGDVYVVRISYDATDLVDKCKYGVQRGKGAVVLDGAFRREHAQYAQENMYRFILVAYSMKKLEGSPEDARLLDTRQMREMCHVASISYEVLAENRVKRTIEKLRLAQIQTVLVMRHNVYLSKCIAHSFGVIESQFDGDMRDRGIDCVISQDRVISSDVRVISRSTDGDVCRVIRESSDRCIMYVSDQGVSNDVYKISDVCVGFCQDREVNNQGYLDDSHMLVFDRDLDSVLVCVRYGRHTVESLRRALQYNMTTTITVSACMLVSSWYSEVCILSHEQLIWIGIVTLGLSVAGIRFDVPDRAMMLEKPEKKGSSLISSKMVKHVVGQVVMQTGLVLYFLLKGPSFLPDEVTPVGTRVVVDQLGGKWVRPGQHMGNQQDEAIKGSRKIEPTVHFTYIFGLILWMNMLNFINCRTVSDKWDTFSKLLKTEALLICFMIFFLGNLGVLAYGGAMLRTTGLGLKGHLIALGYSTGSLFMCSVLKLVGLDKHTESEVDDDKKER